ncbi:hypothetical protein LCGC14_0963800 [marine sediment metagenome]|uniref:Uncharacterized protein n=1 Tax=marine sediment metagenome TaxID=412755 RepID=A0A0F9RK70_9ZZZZ
MVTWDELKERKDDDAKLIKMMLNWIIDFNEYDPIKLHDLFDSCRKEALGEM